MSGFDQQGSQPPLAVVVGLGNPGERYERTRHNVGFRVVEELARRRGLALDRLECNALVALDAGTLLVLPQTFMNRSGFAVRCLAERRGFGPADLLVVYDEVQLPLGRLRLRPQGSPGGHRGMESIAHSLCSDEIARLRCGVAGAGGPPAGDGLADYVLASFEASERELVEQMVARAADACECWLAEGSDAAMSRFNA